MEKELQIRPESVALVEYLDPHRDYGELTYQDICDGIMNGTIYAKPGGSDGVGQPVLRNASTGYSMAGSGKVPNSGVAKVDEEAKEIFKNRINLDINMLYDLIVANAKRGNVKAQMWLAEKATGKPTEERVASSAHEIATMMANMNRGPVTINMNNLDADERQRLFSIVD